MPFEDGLLLGTTDHPYHGDPAAVAPDAGDERQMLEEAGRSLMPAAIDPARIRQRFAGLRALPVATGRPARRPARWCSRAGRRHGLDRRRQAHDVAADRAAGAALACRALGRAGARRRPRAAAVGDRARRPPWRTCAPGSGAVEPATVAHLVHYHGAAAAAILEQAMADRALLEPLAPGAPDIARRCARSRP